MNGRTTCLAITAVVALSSTARCSFADTPSAIESWRRLPVLHGGRVKPFDSVARDTVRAVAGRERPALADPGNPAAGELQCDPVELAVQWLVSWSGWDRAAGSEWRNADVITQYWFNRQPDRWDQTELLLIQGDELLRRLKLPATTRRVSVVYLRDATIDVDGRSLPFLSWAESLPEAERKTVLGNKAHELWGRYAQFILFRMGGDSTGVVPTMPSARGDEPWLPLALLLKASDGDIEAFLGDGVSTADLDALRGRFTELRTAFKSGIGSTQFASATVAFRDSLAKLGESVTRARAQLRAGTRAAARRDMAAYPSDASIVEREVKYNAFQPFQKSAFAYLAATVLFAGTFAIRSRGLYWTTFAVALLGTVIAGYGMVERAFVSGTGMESGWRAPVTNLYETVIWVGFFVCALGLSFEGIYQLRWFGLSATLVSAFLMLLADQLPVNFGKTMPQLNPVLRTNYYLMIHVLTIVSSYGAGALGWGVGLFALGVFLFRGPNPATHQLTRTLALCMYRTFQVAVILLAAGTILGGVWAYDSWGRFWGWDPKEIWALISLLCYLIVLHGRYAGTWNTFGMAVGSNLCFLSIVMSWYGVNFVLPLFNEGKAVGLHGYAIGEGGLGSMTVAVGANLLYLGLATVSYYARWRPVPTPTTPEHAAIETTLERKEEMAGAL